MKYPDSLMDLIESFKKLSGIGEKTAERLAFNILNFKEEEANKFSDSIKIAKSKIKPCSICGTLTDDDLCFICSDKTRNSELLIVVEDSKEVFLIERIGTYRGFYHVLGGLISPLDDIGPEDIEIRSLFDRIEKDKIKEVVLAVKSGIEADATSLYIKRILEKKEVKISRIASGIPIGADMDYVDSLTLDSALKNRKEVF